MVKYVSAYQVYTSKKDQQRTYLLMFMRFLSDFLYKSICCKYSFELHQQVDTILMGTHNICLNKEVHVEVDRKCTGCNMKLWNCLTALIGVCAVIRLNMVLLGHISRWDAFNHKLWTFFSSLHENIYRIYIENEAWQNLQNSFVPSEDSDQTGHLPSLIWVFPVHSMDS